MLGVHKVLDDIRHYAPKSSAQTVKRDEDLLALRFVAFYSDWK